jgi:uncharacterized protein (DUF1778 family)
MLNVSNDTLLSVPIPRQTQYVYRGLRNTKVPDTNPISIRWTVTDRQFIDKQANRIGITFSEFVRWVAYHAALEVDKLDYVTSFKLVQQEDPEMKDIDFSTWDD